MNTIQKITTGKGLLIGPLSFFLLLIVLTSCSSDFTKKLESVPTAMGVPNQISIVADDDLWNGPLGDTLRYYFSSAYPILPQPEPIFDLRHFTPKQLNAEPLYKERRVYLIVGNLNDESSATAQLIKADLGNANVDRARRELDYNTTVARDKWARGQLLVYLFGNNSNELIDHIKNNFSAIASRINEADKPAIDASVYLAKENPKLITKLKSAFDIYLKIPGDYFEAVNTGKTIWLRKENEFLSSNLLIHRVPYQDKSQFSKNGIKAIRDSLGLLYISSEIEATYMRTNDVDLPMLCEAIQLNGHYAMEARGIWDIVNDYMGRAFH